VVSGCSNESTTELTSPAPRREEAVSSASLVYLTPIYYDRRATIQQPWQLVIGGSVWCHGGRRENQTTCPSPTASARPPGLQSWEISHTERKSRRPNSLTPSPSTTLFGVRVLLLLSAHHRTRRRTNVGGTMGADESDRGVGVGRRGAPADTGRICFTTRIDERHGLSRLRSLDGEASFQALAAPTPRAESTTAFETLTTSRSCRARNPLDARTHDASVPDRDIAFHRCARTAVHFRVGAGTSRIDRSLSRVCPGSMISTLADIPANNPLTSLNRRRLSRWRSAGAVALRPSSPRRQAVRLFELFFVIRRGCSRPLTEWLVHPRQLRGTQRDRQRGGGNAQIAWRR